MKKPAKRRTAEEREASVQEAQAEATQRTLVLIEDAAAAAARVRPEYSDLRRDVMRVVNMGAPPNRIAELLEKCQQRYPEIDATEIYDLRARCTGCWRKQRECDATPCGLDEHGRPRAEVVPRAAEFTIEDVPPPAEALALQEVPF